MIQYSTSSTRPIANAGMISLPPSRDRVLDDRREPRALIVGLVNAIAVGRLEQQHVGLRRRRRIGQHRPRVAPEVAAEQHGRSLLDRHPDERRSQQMAGVDELDVDAVDERHRLVERNRLQLRQRAKRIRFAVERQRRVVPRVVQPVRFARILFLKARRVGQHQLAQVGRARRAEDAAVIPVGHEPRQVAGVIEMRVRQNGRREIRGIERQRLPVAQPQFLETLEQAAIDQDFLAAGLEQVLGAGHRARRPHET